MEANQSNVSSLKKKKQDKNRRRDPRSVENVKRLLDNVKPEEKVDFLLLKYGELYEESRDTRFKLNDKEKGLSNAEKELHSKHTEVAKLIIAKGQLESLCRELQQQNKIIKEENIARIKEEEDRRREVANTFTERLTVLTNLITESKDKSNKFKEENQSMTDKLTELYKQSQQRETHIDTVTKQLELQKKLAETQAKKTEIEREAERHTFLAQKKSLEVQLEQSEREAVLLQEKNRSLEAQVDLYKSQYSDFETTMAKSNKVFDTFKQEMSKMSKQLRVLESERNNLKKRWQSSVNSLIVLSEQHMALTTEQSSLEKKLTTLQKLCRQLQEERTTYLKQLKANNIEPIVPTPQSQENEATKQKVKEAEPSKDKPETNKVENVDELIQAKFSMGESISPDDFITVSNVDKVLRRLNVTGYRSEKNVVDEQKPESAGDTKMEDDSETTNDAAVNELFEAVDNASACADDASERNLDELEESTTKKCVETIVIDDDD
ncbi:hypothetical protein GWI33_018413 [Rhynchophorus ferrugineus]|uniref:Alpha-taxilin n=1 Tax=Rhynchophorus ferrugineus TaxID=354439 RepID=A0A834M1K5_RHYFE|nr:hypothetical protein GWI33_018413 [Rhynchophorus ferrugineus]